MRGGAQAHLLAAEDGAFYVVKAANNPQGRRVLVNEWIAGVFLRHLQISTPECAVVDITPEFAAEHPQLSSQLGSRNFPIPPGWHFGSRYPGDPMRMSVYDYVADEQVRQCLNAWEYAAILPFDKWTSNADGRQSIFYRARARAANASYETTGLVTQMIDHGFIFEGPNWSFGDSPVQGFYPRTVAYERVRGWDDLQPWLDRIVHFPEELFDQALRQIPLCWIEGEEDKLQSLLDRLYARRARTPDLVREVLKAKAGMFPNWTGLR
jgi:hypothetical protein